MRGVTLPVVILLSALSILGQTNNITEREYQSALTTTYEVAQTLPHRRVTVEEYFRNGKKSGFERHVNEAVPPDRKRYLYEAESDGKLERLETITLNGVSFCKEGFGEWAKKNCDRFTGIPSSLVISREFTLTESLVRGVSVRQFRELMKYRVPKDKESDADRTIYQERKFVVDASGKLIGMESTGGNLEPRDITAVSKTTVEYGLTNLKIQAPFK